MLSIDEIMERLGRLSRLGTALHCRTTFPPGQSKWYVVMRGVENHVHTKDMSGSTPEAAIRATWQALALRDDPPIQIRYFCEPKESIPGDGPQVWVKWSQDADDWVDITPPRDHEWQHRASEIRPYQEHKWLESIG